MERLKAVALRLNPSLEIFVTSARTGEGMPELAAWFQQTRAEKLGE